MDIYAFERCTHCARPSPALVYRQTRSHSHKCKLRITTHIMNSNCEQLVIIIIKLYLVWKYDTYIYAQCGTHVERDEGWMDGWLAGTARTYIRNSWASVIRLKWDRHGKFSRRCEKSFHYILYYACGSSWHGTIGFVLHGFGFAMRLTFQLVHICVPMELRLLFYIFHFPSIWMYAIDGIPVST